MDHADESPIKHRAHCGCGGPRGARQGAVSQPKSRGDTSPPAAALDILDERFARGDIEKAEYLEKKQLISQRVPVPKVNESEQRPIVAKSIPTTPVKRTPRRR
jgi:hypothetical protein